MFKKTLGLIAILLLIIAGEGYWLSQSDIGGKWMSLLNQTTSLSDVTTDDLGLTSSWDGDDNVFGGVGTDDIAPSVIATLGNASGTVSVTRNDEPLALIPFMPLLVNDRIETGADGKAEIGWTGYGRTLIAPNTVITITNAEQILDNGDGIVARLKLESGRIWTRLDKLLSAGSSFEVKASNVVATVRGTSFGVGIDALGKIEVKVAKSKVSVARTVNAESDEIVGSPITVGEMERMELIGKQTLMSKPIQMLPAELGKDSFLMEGNAEIPKEYLDMEWMAFIEMILSQIPADQVPADFDRAAFMEEMRQIQAQFPSKLIQTP